MSQQKLLGNVYLGYDQLKNDVNAINTQLASVGKGVNLNFEDKFNKELKKFTASASAEIKKLIQNMSGGNNQANPLANLNTNLEHVKHTIDSLDAKGNIKQVIAGFNSAGEAVRHTADSLGRTTESLKTMGKYSNDLKTANNLYSQQSSLLSQIYALKTDLLKYDPTSKEAKQIHDNIAALEKQRQAYAAQAQNLDQQAVKHSKLGDLVKKETELQEKLNRARTAKGYKDDAAIQKAEYEAYMNPAQLKQSADLLKNMTTAHQQYNKAARSGNEEQKSYWASQISGYSQQISLIEQSVHSTNMDANAKKQILNNLQMCRNEQAAYTAEVQKSSAASQQLANKIITVVSSLVLMRGLRTMWRDAVDYVSTYYDQMNQIRIVSGMTEKEAAKLGKSYRQMGKDMSATSVEIAKAAVEFWRQGLNEDEVNKRLEATIMYSKVASLAFEDSAELMTAATNAFEIEAQRVADVWSVLGDKSAAGADEIGIAMQKASASASEFGLSFEWLSSYIATISEQTREAPEAIGTSLNALMGRLHSIKQKGYNEEDATKINDVAKALDTVGVALLDSEGNWRDMNLIFDDVAAKWSTMTDLQRSYIATTLAGTRQQNRFLTLMNDMSKGVEGGSRAYELYLDAITSAGQANEKYAIWADTVEAAQNRMTVAFEDFYSVLQADVLKGFYDGVAWLVGGIAQATDIFGGWAIVLPVVTAGIVGLNVAIKALGGNVGFLAGTQSILKKHPIIAAVSVAAGLFTVIAGAMNKFNDSAEKVDYEKQITETQNHIDVLDSLISEYDKLPDSVDRSSIQEERATQITDKLAESMTSLRGGVDSASEGFSDQAKIVEKARQELEEYKKQAADLKKGEALSKLYDLGDSQDVMSDYQRQVAALDKIQEMYNEYINNNPWAVESGELFPNFDSYMWLNPDAYGEYGENADAVNLFMRITEQNRDALKDAETAYDEFITLANGELTAAKNAADDLVNEAKSILDVFIMEDVGYQDMSSPLKKVFDGIIATMRMSQDWYSGDIEEIAQEQRKLETELLEAFTSPEMQGLDSLVESYYNIISKARIGMVDNTQYSRQMAEIQSGIKEYKDAVNKDLELSEDAENAINVFLDSIVNIPYQEAITPDDAQANADDTAAMIDSITTAMENAKKAYEEMLDAGRLEAAKGDSFQSVLKEMYSLYSRQDFQGFMEYWVSLGEGIQEAMMEAYPEISKVVAEAGLIATSVDGGGEALTVAAENAQILEEAMNDAALAAREAMQGAAGLSNNHYLDRIESEASDMGYSRHLQKIQSLLAQGNNDGQIKWLTHIYKISPNIFDGLMSIGDGLGFLASDAYTAEEKLEMLKEQLDELDPAVQAAKEAVDANREMIESISMAELSEGAEENYYTKFQAAAIKKAREGKDAFIEFWNAADGSLKEGAYEIYGDVFTELFEILSLPVDQQAQALADFANNIIKQKNAQITEDEAENFAKLLEDTSKSAQEIMDELSFDKLMEGADANYYEGLRDQLIKAAREGEEAFIELWNKLDDSTKSGLMSIFGNVFDQVIAAIDAGGGDKLSALWTDWFNIERSEAKKNLDSITDEILEAAEAEKLASSGYAEWLGMLEEKAKAGWTKEQGPSAGAVDVQMKNWAQYNPEQFKEFVTMYPKILEAMTSQTSSGARLTAYEEAIKDAQLAGLDAVIATTKEKQLQLELDKQLANAESEAYKPVLELLQMSMQEGNAFTKEGGIAGFIEAFNMLSDTHVEGLLTTYGDDFIALVDGMRDGSITMEDAMKSLDEMANKASNFETLSKSALKMADDFGLVRDALNQQTESGYLSYESYRALIDANKEYADAVVYNNGRLMLSSERLKEIESARYEEMKEDIDKQIELLRVQIREQELAGKDVTGLKEQLHGYEAISGEIANMTSAYYRYLMAVESTNLGSVFDQTSAIVDMLQEAIKSKTMYTDEVEEAYAYLTGGTDLASDPDGRKKDLQEAMKSAKRYADNYKNIVKDLKAVDGVSLFTNEDGQLEFDFGELLLGDIAEAMEIGPEFLQNALNKLTEYGYVVPAIPLDPPKFSIRGIAGESGGLINSLMKGIEGELESGDRGEGIRSLQEFLNKQFEGIEGYIELDEDGIFGPKTKAALEQWKSSNEEIETLFADLAEAIGEEDIAKLQSTTEKLNDIFGEDILEAPESDAPKGLKSALDKANKIVSEAVKKWEEEAKKAEEAKEKLNEAMGETGDTGGTGGTGEGDEYDPFAELQGSIDGANSALGILSTNIDAVAAKAIGTLGAEKAVQELKKVMVQLIRINNYQIADKTFRTSSNPVRETMAKGSDGSYAGVSFVAEEGRELIYRKNSGKVEIANDMQMTVLEPGDQVIPNDETERILRRKDMTEIEGFAKGTGNKGLKKKLKEVDKALEDLAKLISYYASAGEYHEIRGELDAVQHYTEEQLAVLEKQEEQLRSAIEALTGQLTMLEDKQSKYKEGSKKWKNLQKQIDKTKESMGEYQQELIDTMTEQERMNQELEEARKEMQQNQIALENEILQAIEDREARNESMLQGRLQMEELIMQTLEENLEREKEIAEESADARIEALQEEINKIDELLEARRKMEEDEDKQKELAGLEAQLARISADPTRMKERLELEKKIADLRKEIAWDIAEEEAEAQKKALEEQIKNIEGYKEELDKDGDGEVNRAELVAEMEEILRGTDEEIIAWLTEHNQEYANSTAAAQQNLLNTWEDTLDQMNGVVETHWDEVEDIIELGEEGIIQFLKDNSSAYKEASETQAQAYVDGWKETIQNSGLFGDDGTFKPPTDGTTTPTVPITESDPDLNPDTRVYGFKYKVKGKWYEAGRASTKEEAFSIAKQAALEAWEQYKGSTGNSARKKINKATAEKPGSFFKAYSEGGLIDYTGLAMVHGSPMKPEGILNAEDTKLFRSFVKMLDVSSRINIPAWPYGGFKNEGGTMGGIQMGDIIVQVERLEDDADYEEIARRVGEAIMNGATKVNVPAW